MTGSVSLAKSREIVSKRIAGLELPSCFVEATISSAVNAFERESVSAKASRRRLTDKALRLVEVQP